MPTDPTEAPVERAEGLVALLRREADATEKAYGAWDADVEAMRSGADLIEHQAARLRALEAEREANRTEAEAMARHLDHDAEVIPALRAEVTRLTAERDAALARAERAEAALRELVAACVNPGDGGGWEAGEFPELDAARAALSSPPASPASAAPDVTRIIKQAIRDFSSPTIGAGDIHGRQAGYIVYEDDGLPFIVARIARDLGLPPPATTGGRDA